MKKNQTSHRLSIFIAVTLLLFPFTKNIAQEYSVRMIFTDNNTSERIGHVNIQQTEPYKSSFIASEEGEIEFTTAHTNLSFSFSIIGYKPVEKKLKITRDTIIRIQLSPEYVTKPGITITGDRNAYDKKSTSLSSIILGTHHLNTSPSLMGISDPWRTLQLIPGIQTTTGTSSGLLIRGGDPGQNQVLFDYIPIYNATHLGSFFSVFDGYNIDRVYTYKTAYHAQYGGKTSSYIVLHSKEGDKEQFNVNGGLGLISSRININGPIGKKTTYNLNYRRSQFELLAPLNISEEINQLSNYHFYDFSGLVKTTINHNNILQLSFYKGSDKYLYEYGENLSSLMEWGNTGIATTWFHLFSDNLYKRTSVYYSSYASSMFTDQDLYLFEMNNHLSDAGIHTHFTYKHNQHTWHGGWQYAYRMFSPNRIQASVMDMALDFREESDLLSHEATLYLNDEIQIHPKLICNVGIRYTFFAHTGPYQRIDNNKQDTLTYRTHEIIDLFHHPEPRISILYHISPKLSIKGGYGRYYQYTHLANLPSVSFPADLWLISNQDIAPGVSDQFSLGVEPDIIENIEINTEFFYKKMDNLIEVKRGIINSSFEQNIMDNIERGKGNIYGWELLTRYRKNNTFAQLSYTWSKNMREFTHINNGIEFPATYDRRHNLNITLHQQLTDKWEIATTFIYMSGHAVTLPKYVYMIEETPVIEYSQRNAYRMPDYHRLDISLTRYFNNNKDHAITLSVFNIYNRKNSYFLLFETKGDLTNYHFSNHIHYISIFSILPSITYNFKL